MNFSFNICDGCISCNSESDVTIRVGDHDFENPTEALIEFDVELITIHENYSPISLENDIAVIKVHIHNLVDSITMNFYCYKKKDFSFIVLWFCDKIWISTATH